MNLEVGDKDRKVIPRLRDFKTTLILGELNPTVRGTDRSAIAEASIDDQIEDWENNRTLAFATDVVGAGFVLGLTDGVQEAANFILCEDAPATLLQRRIARQVKDPNHYAELGVIEETANDSHQLIDTAADRSGNIARNCAALHAIR